MSVHTPLRGRLSRWFHESHEQGVANKSRLQRAAAGRILEERAVVLVLAARATEAPLALYTYGRFLFHCVLDFLASGKRTMVRRETRDIEKGANRMIRTTSHRITGAPPMRCYLLRCKDNFLADETFRGGGGGGSGRFLCL
jgi:hypothetical protein